MRDGVKSRQDRAKLLASALGQEAVGSFRHCWDKEEKRGQGSEGEMKKNPAPLQDDCSKMGAGEWHWEKTASEGKKNRSEAFPPEREAGLARESWRTL